MLLTTTVIQVHSHFEKTSSIICFSVMWMMMSNLNANLIVNLPLAVMFCYMLC